MPTNNSINTPKPIDVSSGGTGLSTATTAYGVLAAGTTATGAFQNIGTGASGEVLTSNGAGALPTFQAAGGGGGDLVLLSSQNLAGVNSVTFNSFVDNTVYMGYNCKLYGIGPTGGGEILVMTISTDNGVTFLSSGYDTSSFQFNYGNSPQFFNWISNTSTTDASLGFFFQKMSNFDIDLLPFGENTNTTARSASYSYPSLVYAGFQHSTGLANAFKLSWPSNLTIGRASLYGYKK